MPSRRTARVSSHEGDITADRPLLFSRLSNHYGTMGSGEFQGTIGFEQSEEGLRPIKPRRIGLVLILFCHLCTWTFGIAPTIWFPRIIHIKDTQLFTVRLVKMLYHLAGLFTGLITDSCIRKKPFLMFSVIYSSIGIGCCLIILCLAHFERTDVIPIMVNSSLPEMNISEIRAEMIDLKPGYYELFFALLISSCIVMNATDVVQPTLGADQIQSREGVRLFYTAFYFISQIGLVIAFSTQLAGFYTRNLILPWLVMLPIIIFFAIISLILAVLPYFTRQVNADLSVLTDGVGILRQAFRRRSKRVSGNNLLSGAAMSNGGDYPDGAVNERVTMLRFAVILLIILPVTLYTQPSDFEDISYNTNRSECPDMISPFSEDGQGYEQAELPAIADTVKFASCAVGVLLLYVLSRLLTAYGYDQPTFYGRFVTGILGMILSASLSLSGYYMSFELTFLSAPRSMQGTTMGMYYMGTGVADVAHFIIAYKAPDHFNHQGALYWYWGAGIGGNTLSLLLLIFIHKRYNLGLSVS